MPPVIGPRGAGAKWFVRDETGMRAENYAEEEKILRRYRWTSGEAAALHARSRAGAEPLKQALPAVRFRVDREI